MRWAVLVLARHTGWSEAELLAMPTSRARWYLAGLDELAGGD